MSKTPQRGSFAATGSLTLPREPHFLWVTEFPLFTQADDDKDFLAHGRWSSSHHPFTAPMFEDLESLRLGNIDQVRPRAPRGRILSSLVSPFRSADNTMTSFSTAWKSAVALCVFTTPFCRNTY